MLRRRLMTEQIYPQCGRYLHEMRAEIRRELEVIPARSVLRKSIA